MNSHGFPLPRQRLFYNNNELDNTKTLEFYDLLHKRTQLTLRLWPESGTLQSYIDVYGSVHCPRVMVQLLEEIRTAFNAKLVPKLTEDGTSGAYRLRDKDKNNIAIFKPIDEECYAPNNPRGLEAPFGSPTTRAGVLSGESCIREVAAYLLDHGHFADVPATTFVEVMHQSLKYAPFTGLAVTSDAYYDIMNSLIEPVNIEEQI
jgi:hypothetical protein